jgi:hypothetical protein
LIGLVALAVVENLVSECFQQADVEDVAGAVVEDEDVFKFKCLYQYQYQFKAKVNGISM